MAPTPHPVATPPDTLADDRGARPSSPSIARHAISLGMAAMGAVLLAAALIEDAQLRLLWYALPAVTLAVSLTVLAHEGLAFNHWRRRWITARTGQEKAREARLADAARQRAAALLESRNPGLDHRARAIRCSQLSIWVADVQRDTFTIEGVHVGSRDFLPETRTYSQQEWVQRLHPQEQALVVQRVAEFVQGQVPEFELEYRIPDERGGWRWILSRGLVIERDATGRCALAAGTHVDIHQRKLAQIAHAQGRSLINTGPVVIFRFALDGDHAIDFMSRNAARLWRYRTPQWTGAGRALASLLHPQDVEPLLHELQEALTSGQPGLDTQVRIVWGDGSHHWQSMRALFEVERGRTFVRGYLLDIDNRKALEAETTRHNQAQQHLVQQLNMAQADSEILQETSDLLNSADDIDEAFEIVRRSADAVFPGWSGSLSAVVGQGGLRLVGQWGQGPRQAHEFELKDCWGLRRGKPHSFLSAGQQLCCRHIQADAHSPLLPYVCVPMSANSETVGALHLFADTPVSEVELHDVQARAERFCETLKLALSNLRLRAWLRDQATRDGLTGLYNRRLLDERLPVEIKRSHRDQLPVSLALLDVDHFKRFNDQFGHDAGDVVLKAISHLLMERVRVYDLACRYGGEELVLLMPGCQLEDAVEKLESIRAAIAGLTVTHQGIRLPPVTVSVGLAEARGTSAESLLRRADEALYIAKNQGRNRVIVQAGNPLAWGEVSA